MENQQFTYVIAPEGCESYFIPGKKYEVSDVKLATDFYSFEIFYNSRYNHFCISSHCAHLDGKDWIIPEIGQWPTGWTRHQKAKCLQNAGVEILTTGFMRIIGEEKGVTTCASTDEYQGRSAKQLEDGYKIFAICFVATIVLIIISLIL